MAARLGLTDSPPESSSGVRRTNVLSLLRRSDRPLTVVEVAKAVDVHANTARFHLDGLVEEGLAERTTEARDTRGRPRILYTSEGAPPGPSSYALLAEMLTGLVSTLEDVETATVELGRTWGRRLIQRSAPSERVDAGVALTRLDSLLDRVGFRPETGPPGKYVEIRLHHCPFRDVSENHTDVVCAIHLGLMQGALAELGAPIATTSLESFVTPQLCIAHLQTEAPTSRKGSSHE